MNAANAVDVMANLSNAMWRIAELYEADLKSRGIQMREER